MKEKYGFMFPIILVLWACSIVFKNIPLALIGGFLCLDWALTQIRDVLGGLKR